MEHLHDIPLIAHAIAISTHSVAFLFSIVFLAKKKLKATLLCYKLHHVGKLFGTSVGIKPSF